MTPVARVRLGWTFLTSHAVVLVEVARNENATIREIADRVNLTERQAHRVLVDLVEAGYIERRRIGRRNSYRIDDSLSMRHPAVADVRIGDLLKVLAP